jgi:hypothetical protein
MSKFLHGVLGPVLLVISSFVEDKLFQIFVFLEFSSHQLEADISHDTNIQIFDCLAVVSCFDHALQTTFAQENAFKL